ncbi:hypothetical protein, partial [Klebsiella pneumoniae]|uniref:hypothetical protein n=1 Tax=Klebsiella pneumoniae TaxID=573 RepID=UPI000F4B0B68
LMMSLWDALRMNMMISYQELVRTFPNEITYSVLFYDESRSQILISYNQSETSEPLPTAHNLSPGSLHK